MRSAVTAQPPRMILNGRKWGMGRGLCNLVMSSASVAAKELRSLV